MAKVLTLEDGKKKMITPVHSGLILDDGTNPHATTKSDVGLSNVPNIDATLRANHTGTQSVATITGLSAVATSGDHVDLSNIGTNTHAQVDSHIASTSNPHAVTITQSITADPGTDITVSELEELSNNSVTSLHRHPAFVATKVSDDVGSIGINDTETLTTYLSLTFTAPVAGTYAVSFSYEWSLNTASDDFVGECRVNGSSVRDHIQEPKDSGGNGVVLSQVGGGTEDSGTDQRYDFSPRIPVVLAAGSNTVDIRWACADSGDTATIYRGSIIVERLI